MSGWELQRPNQELLVLQASFTDRGLCPVWAGPFPTVGRSHLEVFFPGHLFLPLMDSWVGGDRLDWWVWGKGVQVVRAVALLEPLAIAVSLGLRPNFPSPVFVSSTPPISLSPLSFCPVHPLGTAKACRSPQATFFPAVVPSYWVPLGGGALSCFPLASHSWANRLLLRAFSGLSAGFMRCSFYMGLVGDP